MRNEREQLPVNGNIHDGLFCKFFLESEETRVTRILFCIVVLLATPSLAQTTHTVNMDGSGDFTDIQSAIDVAADADIVLVAPGECEAEILDTEAPVLTSLGSNPATVECHDAYEDAGATAEDRCAGDLTPSISASGIVDTVPDSYTVTYTVSDPSGNETTAERTVEVVDTTAPNLHCPEDITFECTGEEGRAIKLSATAVDSCDTDPLITISPPFGSVFPVGTTSVVCQATDASGNTSECSFEVTVVCGRQKPGDCNQDGALDLSDAVCLLGNPFLGAPATLPCGDGTPGDPGNKTLMDSNGDGTIDLSDAVHILGFLFLDEPAPILGTECCRWQAARLVPRPAHEEVGVGVAI